MTKAQAKMLLKEHESDLQHLIVRGDKQKIAEMQSKIAKLKTDWNMK